MAPKTPITYIRPQLPLLHRQEHSIVNAQQRIYLDPILFPTMADLTEKTTMEHRSLKGAESAIDMPTEDSEATKKLLRKCDLHLLPPLMVIYFLSFMDRTNIGMLDCVNQAFGNNWANADAVI